MYIPQNVKHPEMWIKQAGRCYWCQKPLAYEGNEGRRDAHVHGEEVRPDLATVDHVVPISRGGTNAMSNLVYACWECNQGKGDRLVGSGTGSRAGLTERDIEQLDFEQTLWLKGINHQHQNAIKGQIDAAKSRAFTEHVYADKTWYVRAEGAVRARGYLDQLLARRLHLLRKAKAEQRQEQTERNRKAIAEGTRLSREQYSAAIGHAFMEATRQTLPDEQFTALLNVARGNVIALYGLEQQNQELPVAP